MKPHSILNLVAKKFNMDLSHILGSRIAIMAPPLLSQSVAAGTIMAEKSACRTYSSLMGLAFMGPTIIMATFKSFILINKMFMLSTDTLGISTDWVTSTHMNMIQCFYT